MQVVDPSKVLLPASALKAFVGALFTLGGLLGGMWLRSESQVSYQRELGVKIDMIFELWRQTVSEIKERPTRHEFEDLRQELRSKRGD